MAVQKISFGLPFIFCIFLGLQLLLTSVPEYEALSTAAATGQEKSKRVINPKKRSKMSLEKMKALTALTSANKVYHGVNTQVPSFVMLMESSPYYLWEYYSTGLIMSDTCVLIRAYDIADTWNDPPTLFTDYYHTIFIPRYGCDVQHHVREFVFSDPPYDDRTENNDIAVATMKRKIQFGNAACGEPVGATWVSCDAYGPPPGYQDCYWASYGLKTGEEPDWISAPEEISPNANRIKILSYQDCEHSRIETGETIPFLPESEICGQIPDGSNPYCPYDRNGALFCKYWNRTDEHGSGGWGRGGNNHSPPNQNGGWSGPQKSDYVAVGHQTYYYGNYCPERSAALFIKFGSLSYRRLFSTDGCGFKCSSELKPDEKCKGNPSPSLGPVYCIPESSGGWGETHQPTNGWVETPTQLPNGWEETHSSHPSPNSGWAAPSHSTSGWSS